MYEHHNHYCHQSCQTPVGWLRAIIDCAPLVRQDWSQIGWKDSDRPDDVSRETINRLIAYFAGRLVLPVLQIPYPLFTLVTG